MPMSDPTPLSATPAWQALQAHFEQIRDLHLRGLFADDPGRGERMCMEAVGLYLDYSKNRITDETVRLLLELARSRGVAARRDAMFAAKRSTSASSAPFCTSPCGHHGTAGF